MARKQQIDVRTKTMSTEALTCRSWGHSLIPVPTPAPLRAEYRKKGQRFKKLVCSRGCSYWREYIMDLDGYDVIGARSGYTDPDSYLVQTRGTGRLPKTASRGAFFRVAGD